MKKLIVANCLATVRELRGEWLWFDQLTTLSKVEGQLARSRISTIEKFEAITIVDKQDPRLRLASDGQARKSTLKLRFSEICGRSFIL